MKKILKSISIMIMVLLLSLGSTAFAEGKSSFSGGSGTKNDPYLISSADDLREMAKLINSKKTGKDYNSAYYRLTKDVDVSGKKWVPIAYPTGEEYYTFEGEFDGGNHSVSGIKINYKDPLVGKSYSLFGLFGQLSGDALIKDLTISESEIVAKGKASVCAAAFAGELRDNSSIINCHTEDSVTVEGSYQTAGICAHLGTKASISDCSNAASIQSEKYAAGIACNASAISGCSNSGSVVSLAGDAAGIVISNRASITDCSNSGDISADPVASVTRKAAGIVCDFDDGALNKNMNDASIELSSCSNSGSITGGIAGGIAASCRTGSVIDCVNSGEVTAANEAGGILGYFQISPFGEACEEFRVSDCSNSGSVSSSANMQAGGICGMIYGGLNRAIFEDCVNSGAVNADGKTEVLVGSATAGGIIGESRATELELLSCSNSAQITGIAQSGGIVGSASPGQDGVNSLLKFVDCTNSGTVSVTDPKGLEKIIYAGGIVGKCVDDTESGKDQPLFDKIVIENCVNSGDLIASRDGAEARTDDIGFGCKAD